MTVGRPIPMKIRMAVGDVAKADNLDFKWLNLEESDDRTVGEILDEMQVEADGIAEAVERLKEMLGGIDL